MAEHFSRRIALFPAAIGVLLALATACAPGRRGGTDGDIGIMRDAKLLAMLDVRGNDTLLIDELLGDADSERRARAALAIGQLRLDSRYAQLRELLTDPDTAVAANAAFALGLARDSASVDALSRALAGAVDAVAREAAWALGMTGEPARGAVANALGEGVSQPRVSSVAAERSPAVRGELLLATARIRNFPTALLVPWLGSTDVESVQGAAYALSRARAVAAVRPMLELSSHPDELVRQYVARMLDRGAAGDSLAGPAREALEVLLGDTSPRVRVNAVRSMLSYGAESRPVIQRAFRDPDVNVHVAMLDNIGAVLGNDATAWRAAWDADTNFVVRSGLMQAARRARSDALAGYEVVWQKSRDWRQRSAAASVASQMLSGVSGANRVAALRWALDDTDGRVRAAGYSALLSGVQLAADSAVAGVVLRALTDSDVQVRATASSAAGRIGSAAIVPELIAAWEHALSDTDGAARNAAIRGIAALWRSDSTNFAAADVSRIAAFAVPADPIDRRAAAAITPLASWREAGESRVARPMHEYERIARRFLSPNAEPAYLTIRTERGDIRLQLFGSAAPLTVDKYLSLANSGYYRNTAFHRVVPNFVAQDGDPRGDGTGGGGFYLRDEHSRNRHIRGCLGVATSGAETGGSQFYMCHSPQPHLDGGYTVFGTIVSGFDVLDRIIQGDRVFAIEAR